MDISVDLGDGVIRYMPISSLTPNHSTIDTDHERTTVTEYLLAGTVVHRSVHVHLKQGIGIEGILGRIG